MRAQSVFVFLKRIDSNIIPKSEMDSLSNYFRTQWWLSRWTHMLTSQRNVTVPEAARLSKLLGTNNVTEIMNRSSVCL